MLRLLGIISILVIGLTIYVAVQDERATKKHDQKSGEAGKVTNPAQIATEPNKEQPRNDEYDPERDTPRWYRIVRWPAGITTCALLLTLAALVEQTRQTAIAARATQESAVLMKRQADLIEQQAKVMDRTLVLQFRPRVIVRNITVRLSNVAAFGDSPAGQLECSIVNVGGSPAKIFASTVILKVLHQNNLQTLFDDSFSVGEFILQPGEQERKTLEMADNVKSAIRAEDVRLKGMPVLTDRWVYFVGVIWYRDDIGIQRSMGFSRKYSAEHRGFIAGDEPEEEYN